MITCQHVFIVMEMGEITLNDLVLNKEPNIVDMDFIRLYWKQILLGVQFIHKNNIIHRDLKPNNFVLVKGVLKVIDFGISQKIPYGKTSIIVNIEVFFKTNILLCLNFAYR